MACSELLISVILITTGFTSATYHHQPLDHNQHPHPAPHHHPHLNHHPDESQQFRVQDSYGNYGFGYQTHTIKGDGDYRYERKQGGHTEGGYGFTTHGGNVKMDFHHRPPVNAIPVYEPHPSVYQDIPPVASQHIPAMKVHPLEGLPLEKGQLHAAASDAIAAGESPFHGPRYSSFYDVNIPEVLYAESTRQEQLANHLSGLHVMASAHHDQLSHHLDQQMSAMMGHGPEAMVHHGDPYNEHSAYMSTFLDKLMPAIYGFPYTKAAKK